MLELKNICVSAGQNILFKNLNLRVHVGEKLCITGHSGIGKTTLFNALLGFKNMDSGEILFKGEKIVDFKKFRKHIAFLPQNQNIIGSGTIEETIYAPFNFNANKILKPDIEYIKKCLGQLELETDILAKPFDSISGGEKQRIGLIISKCLKREILLLDEPSSALDPQTAEIAAGFMQDDENLTLLSISHDINWQQHFNNIVDFSNLID